MRVRERLAGIILLLGASLWVVAGLWFVSLIRPRWGRRRSIMKLAVQLQQIRYLLLIGAVLLLIGIIVLLIIYLTRRWGRERTIPEAVVVSRFAMDSEGQMWFSCDGLEAQMRGFYVQLRLPDGSVEEYECTYGLYRQLKDGAKGRARCRGSQLLAFYIQAGTSDSIVPTE